MQELDQQHEATWRTRRTMLASHETLTTRCKSRPCNQERSYFFCAPPLQIPKLCKTWLVLDTQLGRLVRLAHQAHQAHHVVQKPGPWPQQVLDHSYPRQDFLYKRNAPLRKCFSCAILDVGKNQVHHPQQYTSHNTGDGRTLMTKATECQKSGVWPAGHTVWRRNVSTRDQTRFHKPLRTRRVDPGWPPRE